MVDLQVMADKAKLFELYKDLKLVIEDTVEQELTEVSSVLRYASDLLVVEYSKYVEDVDQELADLELSTKDWSATTAILLELKHLIQLSLDSNPTSKLKE